MENMLAVRSDLVQKEEELKKMLALQTVASNETKVAARGDDDTEEATVTAYINSARRDAAAFPSPGQFLVKLQNNIANITSVAVVQAKIPLTERAVRPGNQLLSFAVDVGYPPATVLTVTIPAGSYNGEELALEITTQMNLALFQDEVVAGTAFMQYQTTGKVFADDQFATLLPYNVDVTYFPPRDLFAFQVWDEDGRPTGDRALTLYVQAVESGDYYQQVDDIADVLGFSRVHAASVGQLDADSGEYALNSFFETTEFGGGENLLDLRYHYALCSSVACETKSPDYAILSIDALNGPSEQVRVMDGPVRKLFAGDFLGIVYLRDASSGHELSVELNSSTFPIRKSYPNGISRLGSMLVSLYRPDGLLFDLNGVDWSFTLVFTTRVPKRKNKTEFVR